MGKLRLILGWRTQASLVSGLSLALAFPHPGWWFLGSFALVPWLLALRGCLPGYRFFLGFVFGGAYYSWLVWWVQYPHPIAYPLLCLYAGLIFGLTALLSGRLESPWDTTVRFPLCFTSIEFLRGLGPLGFSWGCLGHTTWGVPPLAQWAEYGGVAFLTFLLAAGNGALASLPLLKSYSRKHHALVFLPLGLLVVFTALGFIPLRHWRNPPVETFHVAMVQPNFSQEEKWNDEYFETRIIPDTLSLAGRAAAASPDLVVLPETAIPTEIEARYYPWLRPMVASQIKQASVPMLVGYVRLRPRGDAMDAYNCVVLWPPGRSSTFDLQHYEKMHLVPWGEYVPLGDLLPFIKRVVRESGGGELSAGKTVTVFRLNGIQFGVPICFESTVSPLVRKFVNRGAQLLINITNDAWFRRSGAQDQHRIHSIFRAIENRRSVIRAANTGRTCAILPTGEVQDEIPLYEPGVLEASVPLVRKKTFHTRFGDVFGWMVVAIFLGILMVRRGGPGRRDTD